MLGADGRWSRVVEMLADGRWSRCLPTADTLADAIADAEGRCQRPADADEGPPWRRQPIPTAHQAHQCLLLLLLFIQGCWTGNSSGNSSKMEVKVLLLQISAFPYRAFFAVELKPNSMAKKAPYQKCKKNRLKF